MSITVDISGVDGVHALLNRLNVTIPPALEKAVRAGLGEMAAELATYPPELPDQRYVRTGALKAGWEDATPVFAVEPDGIMGTLTNPTEYGRYVEGTHSQAAVHQGRWPTVGGVEASHAAAVRAAVRQAVADALARR